MSDKEFITEINCKVPKQITEEQALELAEIFAKHLHIPVKAALKVILNDSKFEVLTDS